MSRERPTTCIDSKTSTTKKSEKGGRLRLLDLYKRFLKILKNVKNSGRTKAKKRHHVQTALSVVCNSAWY